MKVFQIIFASAVAVVTFVLLVGFPPIQNKGTPFITNKVNSVGETGILALSQQLGVQVYQGSYFSGGVFTNIVLVNETGTFPDPDFVRGIVEEELEKTESDLLWISITLESNGRQITSGVKGKDPNPAPDGTRKLILNK